MDQGGLKLWDKEKNAPAAVADTDHILKRAYSDIKTEGGTSAPFSKEMRTFEFQPGQAGADAWLRLQGKYGVGNEIMAMVDQHVDHMAREIALHEIFGPTPDAAFAAAIRLAKDKNPGSSAPAALRWMNNERTARLTYGVVSGKGHPVASEWFARVMSGTRNLVGAASLRNLPLTIVPSDTVMTFMAMHYDGMSGFSALSHLFDGTMSKDVARHLQIAAHSYVDYVADAVRRYEDEINISGLARKVPRAVVRATGADLWTQHQAGCSTWLLQQLGVSARSSIGESRCAAAGPFPRSIRFHAGRLG